MLVHIPDATDRASRLWFFEHNACAWSRDPLVREIAMHVVRVDPRSPAEAILSYAQRLPFAEGQPGQWYELEPRQVALAGGDCTAHSTMLVALAAVLGIPARIVWLEARDHSRAHVAVQMLVSNRWQWAEGSRTGYVIGARPMFFWQAQTLAASERAC